MPVRRSFPRRTFLAAAAAVPFLAACGGDDDDPPATTLSVLDTAKGDARFSTLVAAITAAGLTTALSGAGPYTVFAPTNDAFAALLSELGVTQDALLANTALLTAVLQYHVLGSRVASSAVVAGKPITPLAGGYFKATSSTTTGLGFQDGSNRTGRITQTDINATNGVIHVLDKVMLPAEDTVVGVAAATPDFSILVEAVGSAGLADTLSGAGPFTVFAPTNAAFAALLTELGVTKEALLADTALLTAVLTYHVVPSLVLAADVPFGTPVATVETGTFTVANTLVVTDERSRTANITSTDVFASNGVIHVLDRVILPAPAAAT